MNPEADYTEAQADRLTEDERQVLRGRLVEWFGDDRQSFLVSHLAPVVEHITAARALEMSRRVEQAERRAEGAEAEVERLRDLLRETLQQQPFRVAEANRLRAEEAEYHVEQLRDARDSAERRIERAERLIDSWEHDAPGHSNPVFIGRLRECLRHAPAPVRLRGNE